MEIEERLHMSHMLLQVLKTETDELTPDHPELEEIISRANHTRLKMKTFFATCELPQLLEQIELLDSIIITLQNMHNKKGAE